MSNESLAERLKGKLHALFVVLLVLYLVASSFAPMMNQVDLGWQIAQGRWMVQHAAPYSHDVLNYPNLGRLIINEYPLFEIVFYLVWSLGWWGPSLLTVFAYLLLVAKVLRGARRFHLHASSRLAMAIGLMLLFFHVAFPLRPHLVTFVAVIVLGTFLLRHRETQNWIDFWPMALMQIAWTNSHSGFIFGPAMVGLFGAEMTLRHALRDRIVPWNTIRTWLGAFLLILLACLVNPYGWARFYPPFFQDRLESIRAYVGEMEPVVGGQATVYGWLTVIAVFVIAAGFFRLRAISYSFLLLAILVYLQAQSINKAWPIFGLFVPLLVLSSTALTTLPPKRGPWLGLFGCFIATVAMAMALLMHIDPAWDVSIQRQWQAYNHGRTEMPIAATEWMKAHGVSGRLFHRCEDGGWLQMAGYDHGETYSDTGFGKYDEAFIHEVGLVNERPALVPHFLAAYQPDFVECGNFCFQWPYYLRQNGWRLIFYSPNSSVWTRPELRPDLPTVTYDEIKAAFDHDYATYGMPVDVRLFGRNVIALHSMGLDDFAFAKLTGLPAENHRTAWYWEAARFICFTEPRASAAHANAFYREAEAMKDNAVTDEFRAYYLYFARNDVEDAWKILRAISSDKLANYGAELLLKIELDRHLPEALTLARRTDCFDLRNGRHWQYLAQAEEQTDNIEAARLAWKKAVFYFPDDAALMADAATFAAKYHDEALAHDIADSGKAFGAP